MLASAVANAVHNEEQDPDELYVKACFADEGPTLKRFRPRARGRASRIRKRTSHITVIVARMSDRQLAVLQAKEDAAVAAGRGRAASAPPPAVPASRRSRQRAPPRKGGTPEPTDETDRRRRRGHRRGHRGRDRRGRDTERSGPAAPPLDDGAAPEGYDIKGNADSMLYHLPGTPHYDSTVAEVYFDTAASAEAAGFSLPTVTSRADDDAADESGEEN